jgi:protein involved in polysaccharide export with SLBB domain
VGKPGVYGLATATTLLDAIAAAGGVPVGGSDEETSSQVAPDISEPRPSAGRRSFSTASRGSRIQGGVSPGSAEEGVDFSRSFVMRKGKFLPVDFARLIKQGDLSQNIYLAPDDFIFFRPLELPNIYVLGAVASPNIVPYSRDLSVAAAILRVGGTVKYAQENKVVIIRGALAQPQIAEVEYQSIVTGKARNLLLEPGDIVYVPFTPFRRIAQLAEEVLDQFVRTVAANEGTFIGSGRKQPVGVTASDFRIITQ